MIDLAEGRRLLDTSIIEWDNWVLLNAEAMFTLLEQAREVLLQVQWITPAGGEYGLCESCFARDYKGHKQDCEMLALVEALTTTDTEVKHD